MSNVRLQTDPAAESAVESAARSRAWRRFRRNKPAVVCLVIMGLIVLVCVATLGISADQYQLQRLDYNRRPPTLGLGSESVAKFRSEFAPFGYDVLGRNLLWRCLFGGLVSLGIGLAAAAVSVVIGTLWGAIAGWYGGRVDNIMMRLVDILYG
ncbi:MAG: hypothetical protein JW810_00280, partial [Sedimentisphaerales bacterium]|nr:hypothetical protein [Sedimentisphaerales bacterium]